MTNEEAKTILLGLSDNPLVVSEYLLEALDLAIKALEQQSRDCKTCKHSNNGKCAYTEKCHECMWENQYEPQRKHGKWIKIGTDSRGYTDTFECSECGELIRFMFYMDDCEYDYCPYCLADMRGDKDGNINNKE